MTRRVQYEVGQVFGWLTLERKRLGESKPGISGERWDCRCRCGAPHDVALEQLRSGRVRACRRCAKAYRASEDERMMR